MSPLRFLVASLLASLSLLAVPARAGDGAPPLQWVKAGQYDMSGLDITPDGTTLVTSSFTDDTIKVWNLADGSFVRTLAAAIGGVQDIALSPDGTRLISGGEVVFGGNVSAVLLWDVATASVTHQLTPADNEVFCVDWSADGSLVAAGDQFNAVRIWNADTGALVRTLQAPGFGGAFDIAFSPDGTRLLAGYGDNTSRIWNLSTGAVQFNLTGHTFFVDSVAWSPNGARVATGSWDNSIKTWTASTGALEHTLTGHTDIVRDLCFSPDGATLASGSWDHTVRRWNAATGAALPAFGKQPDPGAVNALRFTPDGTRLATGGIGVGGLVLDAASGVPLATVGYHHANIRVVAVSADRTRLASGAGDMDARVWDAATGAHLATFTGHDDVVNAIDLNADATLAVSGSGSPPPDTVDPSVRLWSPVTGQQFHVMAGHQFGTTGVALTPDAQTAISGGRDGNVKRWSTTSGALLSTFSSTVAAVTTLQLSPDGSKLAIAGNAVHIIDPITGALLKNLVIPGGNHVSSLDWSSNGARLLVGAEIYGDNVHLFDVASGALIRTFSGDPDGFIQGVALSPDGHTAACGSGYSRTIRTFSADTGKAFKLYDAETGWGPFPTLPLLYLADGRLAYGRTDATVVMSNCPGHIESYGAARPGSGGFAPTLAFTGCATAGGAVTLSIDDALGGANAFLLLGGGQGSAPFKGCTLLLNPLIPPIFPLHLGGSGAGNGSLTVPAILPPSAPKVTFTMQAWIKDAGGPAGFSATNGVQVSIE